MTCRLDGTATRVGYCCIRKRESALESQIASVPQQCRRRMRDITCPSWQDSHLERTWMIASGSKGSMLAVFPLWVACVHGTSDDTGGCIV